MSLYEFLLFVHVSAVIIWIGAGSLLLLLAVRAERARDDATLTKIIQDVDGLSKVLFIPASLTALLSGILLVIDGDLSWGNLWVVLGLLGWAATFATGLLVLTPRSQRVTRMLERAGGRTTPEIAAEIRRTLTLARTDYVVLFLVVADMTLKPTGDDVGLLVVMALILVAAVAYVVSRTRSIEAPAPASARAGP
jgi:uncharacterized membrane protein